MARHYSNRIEFEFEYSNQFDSMCYALIIVQSSYDILVKLSYVCILNWMDPLPKASRRKYNKK
ncbi:hypothetical protein MJO28_014994 [Puccinia striiformis f. sp. tritici]|uniref:Uncharacterized protein n=1 Tax=Puccinia striiformis f. sp. tritici TaxID=168172 RepID=A0ACC0DR96_9BASI|nr:hypothetical protein MJO28_014994 [Puccinia striiformis f. sp. tritici]